MKFRIREYVSHRHSRMATNVSWKNNNEFFRYAPKKIFMLTEFSLGDDNVLLRYDISAENVSQFFNSPKRLSH
jgi:hypothetical protein